MNAPLASYKYKTIRFFFSYGKLTDKPCLDAEEPFDVLAQKRILG